MANGESMFWMVWNKDGHSPKKTHDTYESARTEAERLARKEPGKRFFVLMAMGSSKVTLPEPEWTNTRLIFPDTEVRHESTY